MKAILVWPESDGFYLVKSNKVLEAFWIECPYDEAVAKILPAIKERYPDKYNEMAAELQNHYHQLSIEQPTRLWKKGCVYFLVSRCLELIKPMPHYFPYAGMWNDQNPFCLIFPQRICELDDLQKVDATIMQYKEIKTWAGRSTFGYIGSVCQGVVIYFGEVGEVMLKPEVFAQILREFGGRTVKVGTSRTDAPRGSLGAWLQKNVTRTAIASYVAPILVAEGLAFQNENDRSVVTIIQANLE